MKKHLPSPHWSGSLSIKRLLLAVTAIFSLLSPSIFAAVTAPKHEMRAAWYSTAWAIDYPKNGYAKNDAGVKSMKAEADAYLDKAKAAGHNAVFFQVRPMADRMYMNNTWTAPSGTTYTVYEPVSSSLSGTRGTNPYNNFDALEYWIEGAHARGLELHAWVNPYRMNSTLSTQQDKNVESWIITWNAGTAASPNNKKVFNPALTQTIARIENVCRVLTGAYDIDGIVFDDYFYPENLCNYTGTDAPDYAQYKAYKDGGGTMTPGDWRRDNVNKMVKSVYKAIKEVKPWVRFGISPAGVATKGVKTSDGIPALSNYCSASDWQYASIGSDPMQWMREKTVDYISPQIYWKNDHKTNPFNKISEWYSIVASKFGRHVFASHSLSFLASDLTTANFNEIADQVDDNRAKNLDNAPGSVMYSAINTFSGCEKVVKERCFATPSFVPAMTWYKDKAANQGKVDGLAKNGTKLTWTAKSGMRYAVYAIPKGVKASEATTADDGIAVTYLQGVVYDPTYTLTSSVSDDSKYWYAVTVLDRYGFEWEPASIGEPSAPVTPPADPDKDYEPATENVEYDMYSLSATQKHQLSLTNIWVRRPDTNPVTLEVEFARDMTVRSGKDQPVENVVYVVSRDEAAVTAKTILNRYDAMTGKMLAPLNVTYDDKFNPGYYPANGVLLDDANQLLTHTLTLANGKLSIAVVNPATGAATTMFSETSDLRVDHLDVYGEVASGKTWYVFAPSAAGLTRWTMSGSTVKATKTIEMSIGNGARAHAVSADLVWVNGSGFTAPALVNLATGKTVATVSGTIVPEQVQATALTTFVYDGDSYMAYQTTAPTDGTTKTATWSLARATDFSVSPKDASLIWTFPKNGVGTNKMVSGDFGAPIEVLLPEATTYSVLPDESEYPPVYLFGYSCGNGLAAYKLTKHVLTGVEGITIEETSDDAPVEYYDLNGRKTDPTHPGVYLRRQGTTVTKVVR